MNKISGEHDYKSVAISDDGRFIAAGEPTYDGINGRDSERVQMFEEWSWDIPSVSPTSSPTGTPSKFFPIFPDKDGCYKCESSSNEPSALSSAGPPSDKPSSKITLIPSLDPMEMMTTNPSNTDSNFPSNDRSSSPSYKPSDQPTLTPSNIPSETQSCGDKGKKKFNIAFGGKVTCGKFIQLNPKVLLQYCDISIVMGKCPDTCSGLCTCDDDMDRKFKKSMNGEMITCGEVGVSKKTIRAECVKNSKVIKNCPDTCNYFCRYHDRM